MRSLPLVVLFVSVLAFAVSGTFRGYLAEDPVPDGAKRWVYLESRNGSVRRVEISHAALSYGEEVRQKRHPENASDGLRKGAGIRVTASQDESGEWEASTVEIIEMPPSQE
ncbi:MAG TPA: hypothetical protein VKW78_19275 [Terriglobales bacterium]|nr:hypothetical protein [Terriglobales bacterium]